MSIMMASSAVAPQEKFEAAVRVIQSLPKNGSFQPSHEMMLRFYGLYKQAKFGACTEPRPAFWDVVRKAKWDAWKKLEALSQEAAMLQYVEELKKVIETMPHTPDVSAFLETLGNFYELVDEDEAVEAEAAATSGVQANGQSQRIRRSIKLAASRMHRHRSGSESFSGGEEGTNGLQNGPPLNGSGLSSPDRDFSEDEDEEFCDVSSSRSLTSLSRAEDVTLTAAVAVIDGDNGVLDGGASEGANGLGMEQLVSSGGALSQHIIRSLSRLEHDVHALSSRLDAMERLLRTRLPGEAFGAGTAVASGAGRGGGAGGGANDPPRRPWWWQLPFDRLALRNVAFIVLWPLVVQFLARLLFRRLRARSVRRALPK